MSMMHKNVLDCKYPTEGHCEKFATNERPDAVADREEQEKNRLLPVYAVDRAGVCEDDTNNLNARMNNAPRA